ncbi:transposase, IS4 family [Desulforamulus reducens MI-1]|uniref:Transposase, IS4 family n=1 Tax=Desulforamulus reducens (strain ATCC BAA-1160 / DSM 100696 / MI-1) TaxID=349161 RepID=A4J2U7_DESRM|nr:IS4-like element ISDre1 family transposase [Desulforamulus reducens]ABO49400.1 transposase, IS4 family [Desulforamulus reducens MI-1]
MDKNTNKSTYNQLFQTIYNEKFLSNVKESEVDAYAKKLTVIKLIQMISYAQLEQLKGLRHISNSLNDDNFSSAVGLDSISASQLSRKLRDLSPELTQSLFSDIVHQFGTEIGFKSIRQELGRIYLIDSSTISLCLSRYRWAEFRKTKSGVKLHLRIQLLEQGVLPDKAIIKPAKSADKTQMDALVVEKDALNVFDRGYLDYKRFDNYSNNGTRFVSRLKSNAIVETLEEFPTNQDSLIKKDHKVILGKDGTTKMQNPLRLIETEDTEGKPVIIITNDFELSAEEISDIYRYRWQIELFFKWIKQHFCVKHFYGLSQQAVENQLMIALITYCLMMLLKKKTGYEGPLLKIQMLLHTCLYVDFTKFVRKLHHKSGQSSRGRRCIDHEKVYNITLVQVLQGEAEHLDDLTYDPIIA